MACNNPQDTNTTLENIEIATEATATILAAGIPAVITGDVTVVQPVGTQLHTVVDSGNITVTNTAPVIPAGLNIAGRITTMLISTSALELPATPLADRNAMSITNLSSDILYIGFANTVTADQAIGTTAGWEVGPNESFNIDVQGTIPIYGISAVNPILVKIMELS